MYKNLHTFLYALLTCPPYSYPTDQSHLRIDKFQDSDLTDSTGSIRYSMLTSAVSTRYNINHARFRGWIRNLKGNQKNQERTCRPRIIEDMDGEELRKSSRAHESNSDPTVVDVFNTNQYHQLAVARAKRLKVDPTLACIDKDTVPLPSRNSIKKYDKKYHLKNRKSQALTEARRNAMTDIRLVFTTAVFVWALALNKEPHLIWNVDATTFECKPKGI